MKLHRCLCICGAILFLILPGCQKEITGSPQMSMPMEQPVRTLVSIQYEDLVAEVVLSQEDDENFCLEFQAPEELQGMTMLFAPDQVTIEYRGLAGSYQPDSIPQAAIGKLLVEAITLFRQGKGVEMSLNGTTLIVQGKLKEKGDAFTLTMDAQTGLLCTLSIPAKDFEATFSEMASS